MLVKLKKFILSTLHHRDKTRAVVYRFFKYGCVQIVAYGFDLGAFLLCDRVFFLPPIASNIAGKICSGTFAFFVHRHFTFQPSPRGLMSEARRYGLLAVLNAVLSSGLLYGFSFALSDVWAKIAGDVVCVGLTFMLVQKIVFPASVAGREKY